MTALCHQVLNWELGEVVQMAQQRVIIAHSPVRSTYFQISSESTVYCITVCCSSPSVSMPGRFLEMHVLIFLDQNVNITPWLSHSKASAALLEIEDGEIGSDDGECWGMLGMRPFKIEQCY